METGIGIVLLVVFAIGLASVLSYFVKLATRGRKGATQGAQIVQAKYVRVGHGNVLTNLNDLPQYKGETGLFGLPRYRDVIVPNKHNYATVVYMDHPVKQYVYDVMAGWKAVSTSKDNPYGLFALIAFPTILLLLKPIVGMILLAIVMWLFLVTSPSGRRAVRCSAENAKDFTPETWRGIYRDVAESIEREDELVRAIRRSGVRRL